MNTTIATTLASIKTRAVRYIAKCKSCGETMSTLATVSRSHGGFIDMAGVFVDTKGQSGVIGNHALSCRKCGQARSVKPVKGTFSREHICSDKCTSSKGFSCECSCGGKNHGAAWSG